MTIGTAQSHKTNSYDKTIDKAGKGVETVYSDGKEAAKVIYKDLKDVAPKVSQGVEALAKGLKVGANNVWDILVRQQKVWSIGYLLLTIGAIINWAIFYRKNLARLIILQPKDIEYVTLKKDIIGEIPNPKFESYYLGRVGDPRGMLTVQGPTGAQEEFLAPKLPAQIKTQMPMFQMFLQIFHLACCVVLSGFSFYHFSDMLTGFLNPEFGAIKTIATIVQAIK